MGVGMRLVRSLRALDPEMRRRVWDADTERLQEDVNYRLHGGRGVLGIADDQLPEAMQLLEKLEAK